jgi:hypothetical protein
MTTASPDPSAVLTYARPFVTKHDFSRLTEQKYADLARSMSRRGWGLLTGFGLAALVFLLNALMRGVQYMETPETGHLTALGMWSLAALLCLIYGSRYFSRLRRVAGFFAARKAGS